MKPLQKFGPEYLDRCRKMTKEQIVTFLENYRKAHAAQAHLQEAQSFSVKIPKPLLDAFRVKCQLLNTPYQTQIKKLMKDWL